MIESPLPGDLVICPQSAPRAGSCYAVAVWPDLDQVGTAYQSYGYALLQARAQARVKAVAVWRNHSLDSQKTALENVSTIGRNRETASARDDLRQTLCRLMTTGKDVVWCEERS